jgi:hypothetical protein
MYTQKVRPTLFQKRPDLTIQNRFLIAYIACFQNKWGTVTRLADKYNVSRTFIYDLSNYFSHLIEKKISYHKFVINKRVRCVLWKQFSVCVSRAKAVSKVFLLS